MLVELDEKHSQSEELENKLYMIQFESETFQKEMEG